MSAILTLWRRETRATFTSWTGYTMLAAWSMVSGVGYVLALRQGEDGFTPLAVFWSQSQALGLPVLCAAATMWRFSAERSSGTLETLLTAPVRESDVVAAKYAAALTVAVVGLLLAMIGPLLALPWQAPALAYADASPPLAPLVAGMAALLLQAGLWTAVGLLFSLLCRQQALTAALTLLTSLALPNMPAVAGRFWPSLAAFSSVGFPSSQMAADMTTGIFSFAPLVCHLAATACVLFLTVRLLELRHFRTR